MRHIAPSSQANRAHTYTGRTYIYMHMYAHANACENLSLVRAHNLEHELRERVESHLGLCICSSDANDAYQLTIEHELRERVESHLGICICSSDANDAYQLTIEHELRERVESHLGHGEIERRIICEEGVDELVVLPDRVANLLTPGEGEDEGEGG